MQYLACKEDENVKKPFIEKKGDWICFQCKNLNFTYRNNCNICGISKLENTKNGISVLNSDSVINNNNNISSGKNSVKKNKNTSNNNVNNLGSYGRNNNQIM